MALVFNMIQKTESKFGYGYGYGYVYIMGTGEVWKSCGCWGS